MHRGVIDCATLSGGCDLRTTLESGQSYLWRRRDGRMYDDTSPADGWYEAVIGENYYRVREIDHRLEWESTWEHAASVLYDVLRLGDDLEAIYSSLPEEPLIEAAIARFPGLRLVRDPPFPCLVSFICSSQMRIERIHAMQARLADSYGDTIHAGDASHSAFPTPQQLADATESELRELGLGYRAPYVLETARLVANGSDPEDATSLPYEEAREYLTQYPGVGEKVADCVLLFSLGFTEAVPLDTWIRSAIERAFPDCDRGRYIETSRAIRRRFGNRYAGYAQTYVFHHLRTGGSHER